MVVNLGFEREHVVDALRHQLRNKATVAYFLLLDNRRNLFGGYLARSLNPGSCRSGGHTHLARAGVPRATPRVRGDRARCRRT